MNSMVGRFIIYFFSSHIGLFICFLSYLSFAYIFGLCFLYLGLFIYGFAYCLYVFLFSVLLFAFFVFACLLLKSDKGMDLGEAELRDRKAVISIHCIYILLKMRTY